MPAYFDVNNGTVDIRFQWNGIETARAQEIVFGAARYLYDAGQFVPTEEVGGEQVPVPFDDLSTQQKLTMVFQYTQYNIIEQAKTAKVNTDTSVARDAAIAYAETEYDLG